jgi:hypothetical protein
MGQKPLIETYAPQPRGNYEAVRNTLQPLAQSASPAAAPKPPKATSVFTPSTSKKIEKE